MQQRNDLRAPPLRRAAVPAAPPPRRPAAPPPRRPPAPLPRLPAAAASLDGVVADSNRRRVLLGAALARPGLQDAVVARLEIGGHEAERGLCRRASNDMLQIVKPALKPCPQTLPPNPAPKPCPQTQVQQDRGHAPAPYRLLVPGAARG
jgi:hypothetical protein